MKRIEQLSRYSAVLLIVIVALCSQVERAAAQQVRAEPLEIGPSGEAYLRAKGRRVNANVGYYDPTRAAPPLKTDQTPDTVEREKSLFRVSSESRPVGTLIAGAILAGVIFLFLRFGGSMAVSLRPAAENAARTRRNAQVSDETAEEVALRPIKTILRMTDRGQALMLLSRALLAQVVEGNGLLFQRSWTARDALRRLPRTQPHLDEIKALVLASERVQFGNRAVSEEDFGNHVRAVSPLLKGAMS